MMSANQEAKKVVVSEIQDKLDRAQGVVFLDYRGLTVEEVTELRNQCRAANVEYRVLKNKLIDRAANNLSIEGLTPYLEGPTAVAFGYDDPVAPAKVLCKFIEKTKKTEIKCGLVDNRLLDVKGVEALSELPPKEVLVAKLLGSLNSPISGFVGVLSGTIRKLVGTLDAVREQKEQAG